MIQWILKNTKMNIALIPHVVWNQNDDRSVLQYIARQFKKNRKRLCVIEDCNCMELKAYISQLRFFGLRSNSCIYSSIFKLRSDSCCWVFCKV